MNGLVPSPGVWYMLNVNRTMGITVSTCDLNGSDPFRMFNTNINVFTGSCSNLTFGDGVHVVNYCKNCCQELWIYSHVVIMRQNNA